MLDIDKIQAFEYEQLGKAAIELSKSTVALYESDYESQRMLQEPYNHGWHSPFTSEHRYMNRVILEMFAQDILPDDSVVMDIGCYDGMLVKLLCEAGIDAYGWDQYSWNWMWKLIGIKQRINCTHPPVTVITMLNYCHNWPPEQALEIARTLAGNEPDYIFMDREEATPHKNNPLWYDKNLLKEARITVIPLPNCRRSKLSERDLMVWQRNP